MQKHLFALGRCMITLKAGAFFLTEESNRSRARRAGLSRRRRLLAYYSIVCVHYNQYYTVRFLVLPWDRTDVCRHCIDRTLPPVTVSTFSFGTNIRYIDPPVNMLTGEHEKSVL
jgi:hypothetical protein